MQLMNKVFRDLRFYLSKIFLDNVLKLRLCDFYIGIYLVLIFSSSKGYYIYSMHSKIILSILLGVYLLSGFLIIGLNKIKNKLELNQFAIFELLTFIFIFSISYCFISLYIFPYLVPSLEILDIGAIMILLSLIFLYFSPIYLISFVGRYIKFEYNIFSSFYKKINITVILIFCLLSIIKIDSLYKDYAINLLRIVNVSEADFPKISSFIYTIHLEAIVLYILIKDYYIPKEVFNKNQKINTEDTKLKNGDYKVEKEKKYKDKTTNVNNLILIVSALSLFFALIIAIKHNQLEMLMLSILTSIVAACIFYYFQVYIPKSRFAKKSSEIFKKQIISNLKYVCDKLFLFDDIIKDESIVISSKYAFYKYKSENNDYLYTFFNYQDDLRLMSTKFNKALEIYGDYCLRYGSLEQEEEFLNVKTTLFFNVMNEIFNQTTDQSFYPANIHMKEYKEYLQSFKKSLAKLSEFSDYERLKVDYKYLDVDEIKIYLNAMKSPKLQVNIKKALPYIYAYRIVPNIRFNNNWYRVIDVLDPALKIYLE